MPSGKPLVHSRLNYQLKPNDIHLPCGQCIGCKIQKGLQWSTRCLHESTQHTHNDFLTLTIADRKSPFASQTKIEWPSTETLERSCHQKFLKRMRSKVGPFRYYMCGEYGEELKRPHYHYLIFGHSFKDRKYSHTSDSGEKLYTSEILNGLWPFGKAWIGHVTYESCAYVAAYVMKKLNGPKAENHYRRTDEAGNDYWLKPEYNEMSRRPGIGRTWWQKFHQDITTEDHLVTPGGARMRPPRYYDKLLELYDPTTLAVTKLKRELRAKELEHDNTPARLQDKEIVTRAKIALKKRNLEHT